MLAPLTQSVFCLSTECATCLDSQYPVEVSVSVNCTCLEEITCHGHFVADVTETNLCNTVAAASSSLYDFGASLHAFLKDQQCKPVLHQVF